MHLSHCWENTVGKPDALINYELMGKKRKAAKESFTTMTELVLPNDTNTLNNLMGGRLMHWMDIVSAIAALKHSNITVVTASVDNVSFTKPIQLGNVVTLQAQVTRSFNSSMEVHIEVWSENILSGSRVRTNGAFFTFVAVDKEGKPMDVAEVKPETENERELYEGALRRRQLRLVLAKRMDPQDASEIRSLFDLNPEG